MSSLLGMFFVMEGKPISGGEVVGVGDDNDLVLVKMEGEACHRLIPTASLVTDGEQEVQLFTTSEREAWQAALDEALAPKAKAKR